MKFGILFRPQDPPNAEGIVRRWQEILAAARVAEESGFDGLFVPEHHMMPDGYLQPAARWLGQRLARGGRAHVMAAHPRRSLVLLQAGPAMGGRARAVP
jgi:alkanesulfonate monooxygenase SsuD/methylene tetrahydromethanopterin reductase-like flavin-dependent oxidoreductase (luciferase family)